ncbi:MAG: HEAT repeat domain-containing protein [Planctomycetota bacterium]|jgi:predicted nucleotidyltransferase/transcriptional regulator with XRE-family HTH domain
MATKERVNGYIALDVGKLRELMSQHELRQTQLAERAKLSRVRLSVLLRDESPRVHIGTERKLASAFGLPAGALDKDNVEASYRKAVVQANDTLDFTGLGIVSTDRPVPMDRGFAPLRVRMHNIRGSDRVPDGQSSSTALRAFKMEQALTRSKPFFLLGDPGTGKTTTLRHLAYTYASGGKGAHSYPAEPWIPIYLRLADWAHRLDSGANVDVVDAAITQLGATHLDAQSTSEWLRRNLAEGSALVLLDGLDEVTDPDVQTRLIEGLRSFVQEHREAHVVIASRIVGFNTPNLGAEFDQLTIEPLDEMTITQFVKEWSAFRHEHKSSRECAQCSERTGRLLSAVLRNPPIHALAGNPMMLTILCLLHDAGATLPQRCWQLYEKIAEAFLFSWEEKKRAGTPGALDHTLKLDDREVLWLLKSIALEMQRKDFTIVPRWWLLEHCATFLRTELQFTDEDARSEAEVLVWSLQERSGLLVERGLERFGFRHLGFQEYFAATAVLAQDDAVDYLQQYVYHPRWREVVGLAAAQLDRRRASQLLRSMLDDPDPTARFLHRGLLFALGCLVDGAPAYDIELLEDLKRESTSLANTKWLGTAFNVIDSLVELRATRLESFSQEALHALLGSPDSDVSDYVRLRLQMTSSTTLSQQMQDERGETEDDAERRPVRNMRLADSTEPVFIVVRHSARKDQWVRALLDQLATDTSPDARVVCVRELGGLSKHSTSVQQALVKALGKETQSEVRVVIAGALESAANVQKVRQRLLDAVDYEQNDAVRGACASALRPTAPRGKRVRRKLISVLTADGSSEVRAGAARGLHHCVPNDAAIHDLLLKTLKDETEDDDVQVACLWSLQDVLPSDADAIDSLVALVSESSETRLPGVAAQVLAEYAAAGRVEWDRLPIERIEQVLVALKEPCAHALDALRGLVDARELRRLGIPREARIKQALADASERISCCFVFGSAARGDQGSESDIDLMVIGDASLRELTPGLKCAEQQLGKQVNAVVYSADEWRQRCRDKNPFVMEVLRGKRKFVMGGQDELAAMA